MGLDMYLTGKRFLWTLGEHEDVGISKKMEELLGITKPVKQVDIELGYWRKANAIHKWFVTNVQDGEDDCRDYYVSKEKMQDLLMLVDTVLDNHDKADDLLPTGSGFFFGGTDYDEWYFNDLELTKQILKDAMEFIDEEVKRKHYISIYYNSSW
jgi:hypothetical protein